MNNDEKVFLLAVERGDAATTRHFLDESQVRVIFWYMTNHVVIYLLTMIHISFNMVNNTDTPPKSGRLE